MLPKAIFRARFAVIVAVVAVVSASIQAAPAFASSTTALVMSTPTPPLSKARALAAEQSRSLSVAQELGLAAGEKLVVKDVITDADGATHVRYDRTYNGLRVIGGDLVSHPDKAGRLKSVSWNTSRTLAIASTTPRVSAAVARVAGAGNARSAQKSSSASVGELVVYSSAAAPKLAYDVLTEGTLADQTPSRLHTIVDANTGATLESFDEIETGTGDGIYAGQVPIGTTSGLLSWSMRDSVGNYTNDVNGLVGTLLGAIFTDADNAWGNGSLTNRASAAVDAHYGAGKTFDYYKNVLGRNGIWNTGAGARSRVHYGNSYSNAFWDGSQMTYGDGAGNARPLVELDVAAHEMSHGVNQATAGLVYTGDAGGLNEANSDIFGTAVEWYTNNPSDRPDYLIGELININGNGTPLRYMDKPSKDGVSKDCWSSTLGALNPHYSSGPLNHWFYLASEGSGAKVINGVSYNSATCNGSTVTPIGRAKAEKIWYRTLSTYLTSNSNYAAARTGAIKSAKDLYGALSPECAGIEASFSAIGVPAGAETCVPPSPPPPSVINLLLNPGFEYGAVNWVGTAGVIGQNGANEPTRTGTWNAWMDGYGSAHTDSFSQSVTIPAGSAATLTYYVHIDTAETTTSSEVDVMTVRLGSTAVQTLSNLDSASGYQLKSVDLSAYAGQTVSLSFTGVESSALQTSFVIDDAAVTIPPPPTTPAAPTGTKATAGNGQAAVSWAAPSNNGGSSITGYTVTASPGGRTATSTGATTATVTGLSNGTGYTFRTTARNVIGTSSASSPSAVVIPKLPSSPVRFTAKTPTRVLDTRSGLGAPKAKLGAGRALTLTVPGLPVGATAVALNVTVASPTATSHLIAYPGGQSRPTAPNLNYLTGRTTSRLVVVRLGTGKTVTFYNAAGTVNVIAHVVGYHASGTGAGFVGKKPVRFLDTRSGLGAPKVKLGAGRTLTLTVPGLPSGVTAVALSLTVTGPTLASSLVAYPGGHSRPATSNMNYAAGQTTSGLAVVPLGVGRTVTLYNVAGAVNVIADLEGYYVGTGAGFTSKAPTRVLDTRTGIGAVKAKLGAGRTLVLKVPGLPFGATAVAMNVTVTNPTVSSYLTLYPAGVSRPIAANLTYAPNQTISTMVLVPLGAGGSVTLFNLGGTTNVLADLVGYYN